MSATIEAPHASMQSRDTDLVLEPIILEFCADWRELLKDTDTIKARLKLLAPRLTFHSNIITPDYLASSFVAGRIGQCASLFGVWYPPLHGFGLGLKIGLGDEKFQEKNPVTPEQKEGLRFREYCMEILEPIAAQVLER